MTGLWLYNQDWQEESMTKELLDLNIHDPEEFEGKIVVWNGAEYAIGKYVGSGAQIFAYQLIHLRSGLGLHVIKIWRNSTEAKAHVENREHALFKEYLGGFMPTTVTVFGHGGAFDIQDYVGLYEDDTASTTPLIEKANDALENSEYRLAVDYYKQALEINPYHTVALNNLASTFLAMGDRGSAYTIWLQILDIEPNYLPYSRAATYIAALLGYGRTALQLFTIMKDKFTINLSLQDYDLGINIHLGMGLPQPAHELFVIRKQFYANDAANTQIEQKIKSDLSAQKKASDLIDVMSINDIVALSDEKLLPILENAYAIYSKNPYIKINLALAYQRIGKFTDAKNLILSVVRNIDPTLENVCIFHLAYGSMRAQNFTETLHWLDAMATTLQIADLSHYYEKDLLLLADLPGITKWIDESGAQLAESFENTVSFIKEISVYCDSVEAVPKNVVYIIDLYEKGFEQYLAKKANRYDKQD
jgi:tetratricopeptide (TPR) repeat protein